MPTPRVTGGESSVAGGINAKDWLGGLAGTKLVDGRVDKDTHNLHAAADEICPSCRRIITQHQVVRRTASGAYKHDAC